MSQPSTTVRVAVAGLGRAGIQHAALLPHVPGVTLVGIMDPRPDARGSARGMGLTLPGFGSFERMVARTGPQAVVVCTPEPTRPAIVRAALEHGLDVLVERPMAPTLEEAERMVAEAVGLGRRLAVTHPLVFEPVFAHTAALIDQGRLGPITGGSASMFMSRVLRPRARPRIAPSAGGVVARVASDLLLLIQTMLGPPREVSATWTRLYGPVEDELHGALRLEGGVELGFDASWSAPGYPRPATVVELHGAHGALLASDDALELELQGPIGGSPAGHTRLTLAELPQSARFDLGGEGPWQQLAAFVGWVAGGPAPPNAAPAALAVPRLVEALYASARAGGETVVLSRAGALEPPLALARA